MHFNQQDTVAIYGKVISVIRSCQTLNQLLGARKFATLYLGRVVPGYRSELTPLINRALTRQKTWIIRHGNKKTQGSPTDRLDRAS